MKIWAKKTVIEEFTNEELELLIDASLNNRRLEEASEMLRNKYGGVGQVKADEIRFQAFAYDSKKYHFGKFNSVSWY